MCTRIALHLLLPSNQVELTVPIYPEKCSESEGSATHLNTKSLIRRNHEDDLVYESRASHEN